MLLSRAASPQQKALLRYHQPCNPLTRKPSLCLPIVPCLQFDRRRIIRPIEIGQKTGFWEAGRIATDKP
jgi:hypothetical protein